MAEQLYNEGLFKARTRIRKYQMVLADGLKHPMASKFGKTVLPLSNMTPAGLAIESELLPHTQVRTQNFLSINPCLTKPKEVAKVNIVPFTLDKFVVPVLRIDDVGETELEAILIAFICPFFTEGILPKSISNSDIYRAWCTLYGSLDREFTNAVANIGLVNGDLCADVVECKDINTFIDSYCTEFPPYKKFMGDVTVKGIDDKDSLLVISCILLQTAGKYVYPDNYQKWYSNRAKAASGMNGGGDLTNILAAIPTVNGLQKGHTALNALFEFRRMLVDRMFAYEDSKSKIGRMFTLALQMLASTDLTHVYNIDLYVVKLVPEIMNLNILRSYDDQLVHMYEFWLQYADIFPYVRFYIAPKYCHCINRNVLMPLIVAAQTVATYTSDTFKNYRGSALNSQMYRDVHQVVAQYLQQRKDASGLALGSSDRTIATEVERDYLLRMATELEEGTGATQLARELTEAIQE